MEYVAKVATTHMGHTWVKNAAKLWLYDYMTALVTTACSIMKQAYTNNAVFLPQLLWLFP